MIEVTKLAQIKQHLDGLKVIVFDMDDTLYGEKEYVRSGYRAIAKTMPEVEDMEEKLWKAFEERKSAIDEVLLQEGIYSEEVKQKCLTAYRFQEPEITLYEGVEALLVWLKEQGYKIGIITDGRPEGQRAKIKALGLETMVDHIIVTDELGGIEYRKPNKAAFVKMQEVLGVPFEEMCYIGDNKKKDFIAPQLLHMKTFWFKNKDGLYYEAT